MGIEELKDKTAPLKNTLVIDFLSIAQFIDVIEGDDDIYYLFETESGPKQVSCLCDFVPLKGNIPQEKYERLVYFWNRNKNANAV